MAKQSAEFFGPIFLDEALTDKPPDSTAKLGIVEPFFELQLRLSVQRLNQAAQCLRVAVGAFMRKAIRPKGMFDAHYNPVRCPHRKMLKNGTSSTPMVGLAMILPTLRFLLLALATQQLLGTPGVTLGLMPDSGLAGRDFKFGTLFEFLTVEFGIVANPLLPLTEPAEPTLAPHGIRGPAFPVVGMLGELIGAMIVLWPSDLPLGIVGVVGVDVVPPVCAEANGVARINIAVANIRFLGAIAALRGFLRRSTLLINI